MRRSENLCRVYCSYAALEESMPSSNKVCGVLLNRDMLHSIINPVALDTLVQLTIYQEQTIKPYRIARFMHAIPYGLSFSLLDAFVITNGQIG